MVLQFEIPGKVQAKERPRFNRYSGKVYTPEKTHNFENFVKLLFVEKYPDRKPLEGAIYIDIVVNKEVPASASKKKKKEMLEGKIQPLVKPDVDNVAKSILDALNGIAYKDDKQIIGLSVQKFYSDETITLVKIKEMEDKEYGRK